MSALARAPVSRPDVPVRGPGGPRPDPAARTFLRRRLVLAAGLLLALAAAVAVVLVATGSGESPPATGAATIVPADALAYLNVSTDSARPAVSGARRVAARFPDWPLFETAALNRLRTLLGGSSSPDLAAAIRPWLGKEAALALLPGPGGSVRPLVVLDVARRARAQAFVSGTGATAAGTYDLARLEASPSGTEFAFTGHYLVAGSDPDVRAALDASRGRVAALAHDPGYTRAAAGEPADRVLDVYLRAAGAQRLLAARTGVAGAIGMLLERPGLVGSAMSVSPTQSGARVLVHSVFGAGAPPPRSFTPTLQSVLPSGSTLMLDVDGLDRAAPGLLRAAATAGFAANVGPLLHRIGAALASEGVSVHGALSLFAGETAVAIAPGSTPALLIVARVRDQTAARNELAALEAPVTGLFSASSSGSGQIPELADRVVGGTTVHEVGLGPGLQLDYAVTDGLVVISTSVQAIGAVAQRARSLSADTTYQAALPDQPQRVTSLVFLDATKLLRLAEQIGLMSGARIHELLPDLSRVRAIGLSSTSGTRETTTELNFEIP